jgi:hypothetical protein
MKTEKELNAEILKITLTIQEKYPELSEFLGEMSVTIPDVKSPEINKKKLSLYYDSLKSMLENYISQHPPESAK